jgi:hypothetical protein
MLEARWSSPSRCLSRAALCGRLVGRQARRSGKSLIANPTIYALSMAVYCTTWTFYGSVGRAAVSGIGFLPVYLGPTLVMALGWFLLLKMIRIVKANRITSIADFISSRYGKSHLLGGLVTIIAVVGIIPYIALQLKAVSSRSACCSAIRKSSCRVAARRCRWRPTSASISR